MNRAAHSFLLAIFLFPSACGKNSNAEFGQKGTNPDNPGAAATGIDGGSISGNTYKNPALGMKFQVPAGLVPASLASLHALNDSLEATARTLMMPADVVAATGSPHPIPPKYIFYASKKGEWDGRQTNIPSVVVCVRASRSHALDLNAFKHMADNAAIVSNQKIVGSPYSYTVNRSTFFRADFERSNEALSVRQSLIQTLAGDYIIEVEINASSLDEMKQTEGFLQTISIAQNKPQP